MIKTYLTLIFLSVATVPSFAQNNQESLNESSFTERIVDQGWSVEDSILIFRRKSPNKNYIWLYFGNLILLGVALLIFIVGFQNHKIDLRK